MCLAAISYNMFANKAKFTEILRFIQPIAVGIVAYATYSFANKFLKTRVSTMLAIGSLIATLFCKMLMLFLSYFIGRIISSALETQPQENELRVKLFSNVNPNKVTYFYRHPLFFAALGALINQTSVI